MRLKQLNLAQELTGGGVEIIYDDVINPYPDYFSVHEFPGGGAGDTSRIRVLQPGLVVLHARLEFETIPTFEAPTQGVEILFDALDYDIISGYSVFMGGWQSGDPSVLSPGAPMNSESAGYAVALGRIGPDHLGGADQLLRVRVEIPDGSTPETLFLRDNGGGTFFEAFWIGSDPFYPLGLLTTDEENPS